MGRRTPIFVGYALFALMQIPTALVRNLPGLLILRLLAGTFGAAPMTLVSAVYSDFWGELLPTVCSLVCKRLLTTV